MNEENIKIRKFIKKDVDICKKIIYDYILASKKTTTKDKERLFAKYTHEKILKNSEKSDFFVFERNKKIIGMGRLEKNKVATIYFDLNFHGKGGGTKIIQKLESIAKQKRLKKIWLKSLLQSMGFYEKVGFKKIRRIYSPINEMRMEKKL